MTSREVEKEKRRSPSPCSLKTMPGTVATCARSRSVWAPARRSGGMCEAWRQAAQAASGASRATEARLGGGAAVGVDVQGVGEGVEGAGGRVAREPEFVEAADQEVAPLAVGGAHPVVVAGGQAEGGERGPLRGRRDAVGRVEE